jgi:hypothetical protein
MFKETSFPQEGEKGSEKILSFGDRLRNPQLIGVEMNLSKAEAALGRDEIYNGKITPIDSLDLSTLGNLQRIIEGRGYDEIQDPAKLLVKFAKESKSREKQIADAKVASQKGLGMLRDKIASAKDESMRAKLELLAEKLTEASILLDGYDLTLGSIDRLRSRIGKDIESLRTEQALPVDQVSEEEIDEQLERIKTANGYLIMAAVRSDDFGGPDIPFQIEATRENARAKVILRHQERRQEGGEIDKEVAQFEKMLETIQQNRRDQALAA